MRSERGCGREEEEAEGELGDELDAGRASGAGGGRRDMLRRLGASSGEMDAGRSHGQLPRAALLDLNF